MWAAITDRMARTFSRTIEVIETTIFITTGAPGETQIPTQARVVTGDIPPIAMAGSHLRDGSGIAFWSRLSLLPQREELCRLETVLNVFSLHFCFFWSVVVAVSLKVNTQ